jgi:hypothetical protein
MRADETCQGMNSRKPLVTGCFAASAITFQMVQEFASDCRCQLLHGHTIDGATFLLACAAAVRAAAAISGLSGLSCLKGATSARRRLLLAHSKAQI